MADPLKKTFDFLASAGNPFAQQVLVAALDVTNPDIAGRAVSALLKRGDTQGFIELVRRFEHLSPEAQDEVAQSGGRMETALQEIVQCNDDDLRVIALHVIERAKAFGLAGPLLKQAELGGPFSTVAIKTAATLADRLYEQLESGDEKRSTDEKPGSRNRFRQNMLDALAGAIGNLTEHPAWGSLLESLLVIGTPDDASVRELISPSADPKTRETIWSQLQSSTHTGVMQFLVASICRRKAEETMLRVFQKRKDEEFALHLLRSLPRRFSTAAVENFRLLNKVGWIDANNPQLDWIPPGLQGRLVDLIAAIGLKVAEKLNLLQWVIRNGSIAGRIAAVAVLSTMNVDSVEAAVLDGLDSEDVDVQAWATHQLREANVPEAFSLLIERLDCDVPEVQAAAREELESFDLQLMLGLFDQLRPEICRRAGTLMLKIHPDAVDDLKKELNDPVRRKKERAIRATRAMGLQPNVTEALIALLQDDDMMIRRSVIDALSDVPTIEARVELQKLLEDESPRIRDAAETALRHNDQVRKSLANA